MATTPAAHPDSSTRAEQSARRPASPSSRAIEQAVPRGGTGKLAVIAPPAQRSGSGRTVHYAVEVEIGLPVPTAQVAAMVQRVLGDPRGWQQRDGVRFVPVTPARVKSGADPDIRVTLASPRLTDTLCAPLDTDGELSCWNSGRAVLNARRWILGAETYGGDLNAYRTYLINHEVGHGLGHGHADCPRRGARAPVMVQQTKSLQGCRRWPWPTGGSR